MRSCIVLVLMALLLPLSSNAQWTMVAPNLVPIERYGAMCYRDGRLWLAKGGLFRSDDKGATWTKVCKLSSPYDLQFIDRSNGITANQFGVFVTSDGGSTWTQISPRIAMAACFVGSPKVAAIAEIAGTISVTTDAGATWSSTNQAQYSLYITTLRDGSLMDYAGNVSGGFLSRSTDLGASWQQSPGFADVDSYMFGVDSCDASRVVLANEDRVIPTDRRSQIFLTTDFGTSYTKQYEGPIAFFSGAVAVSKNAFYCPTAQNGIFRSTDHGISWKSIQGPNNSYDTRLIAAIDDNIIVATDDQGNVWRTLNSGGDSVVDRATGFVISPQQVNLTDTISSCMDSAFGIHISAMCGNANFDSAWIDGPDSLNFNVSPIGQDSISLVFSPTRSHTYLARLHLKLPDGEEKIIPLKAIGGTPPNVTFSTIDISNDTIGGNIYIPLFASSTSFRGAVTVFVHYDTTNLVYVATEQPFGGQDLTITRSPGAFTVLFPNAVAAMKGKLLGSLHFLSFPTNSTCSKVYLDSVHFEIDRQVCFRDSSLIVATVCSLLGCGISRISKFLRSRMSPKIELAPNPSSGKTTITSDTDLGIVTVEINDILGTIVERIAGPLSPHQSISVHSEDYPAGAYRARIISSMGSYTLNLLHLH